MAQEQATKKGKLIIYLGEDAGYFDTIKTRFQVNYPTEKFLYESITLKDKGMYQRIFAHVVQAQPCILYIDFSTSRDQQLKMAQLLTRECSLKHCPIVGLVEEKSHVRDCLSSGVTITHVKCGEYHDVVYNPMLIAFPKLVKKPQFAKAKFSKQVELIDDFRVGYITKDAIHAEGNIPLTTGDTASVHIDLPVSLLPSKNFIVKNVDNKNLYYDFKYSYELQFVYLDKSEFKEEDQEDQLGEEDAAKLERARAEIEKRVKQQEAEHEETLRRIRLKLRDWVLDKTDGSAPKKTKIMVVDRGLSIMRGTKLIDDYPYAIRVQTELGAQFQEVSRFRPNIIAFQFIPDNLFAEEQNWLDTKNPPNLGLSDDELTLEEKEVREKVIEEESEKARSELTRLITYIREVGDYNPFLIIFNCRDYSSNSFQESFKYPLVITHQGNIDLGTITHMAQVLEKKQEESYDQKIQAKIAALKKRDPTKYRNIKASDFEEVRFYVSKNNPLSHASYHYPVTIESLTESELTFTTEAELDLTNFRLNFPISMSIALVPDEEGKKYTANGKLKTYKALIHSVDEIDKKKIRRYVNEIFFDPLTKQREEEAKKYQELQEKVIKEREEASRKKKDAEVKAKNSAEVRNDELISPGASETAAEGAKESQEE